MRMQTLDPAWGITIIRVPAGLILFVAGLSKVSGGGFEGFTRFVTQLGIPLPELWGIFIPLMELIGGALLLVGLGSRWVAILFVIEFAVTTFVLKAPRQPPFGGWDSLRIDLMLFASAVMVVLVGPGVLAIDNLLAGRTALAGSQSRAERVAG